MEWLKDHIFEAITLFFVSIAAWITLKNRVDEGNRILTEVKDNLKSIDEKIDRELKAISDKFDKDLKSIDDKIDAVNLVIAAWKEIDRSNEEKFIRMDKEILSNRERVHKLIDDYIGPMQVEILLLKKGIKLNLTEIKEP